MDDDRYHDIDNQVSDSGHWFNPNTERFEATRGSDAENNLDHDPVSFLATLGGDVTEEELKQYMKRKSLEGDDDFIEE